MQGICDDRRRFIDVDISHPASTSDYLSFGTSKINRRLEEKGFLSKGLCIYGDNAYMNCPFMATLFKAVKGGIKDAYNFYHSQLRINIECSFGILVARWGILRRALSSNFTVKKIVELVECLCRLHNFIIDSEEESENPGSSLVEDNLNTIVLGGFLMEHQNGGNGTESETVLLPTEILHGGEHFDDVDRSMRERIDGRN